MPRADWPTITAQDLTVPAGLEPVAELPDLLSALGEPDPAVRDEQAYTILAVWTVRGHFDAQLEGLAADCMGGLRDTNVLRRSFSALILGEAVRRHAKVRPDAGTLHADALAAWADWYPTEPDTRSHAPDIGWIHTVAHGADTARDLLMHPRATPDQIMQVLDVISRRLGTLNEYLNQGEDDRLALALLMALSRPELTPEAFREWLDRYSALWTGLTPGVIPPGAVLAVRTLHSLHSLMTLGASLGGQIIQPAFPAEAGAAVHDTLRTVYPYYA